MQKNRIFYYILQGDSLLASKNKTLGILFVSGITPRPKGEAKLELTFNCYADRNYFFEVKDKTTNKVLERFYLPVESNLMREHAKYYIEAFKKDERDKDYHLLKMHKSVGIAEEETVIDCKSLELNLPMLYMDPISNE